MDYKPLVSVLMTSYNREKFIAEAIESVLASTYENWELIIVDDVSNDLTVEIAKKYESIDKRIKLYINENNLGDYPNRNRAASYAKGKYLKYLDSDDIIYPYGLEIMVKSMELFPAAGIGFSHFQYDGSRQLPFIVSSLEAYREHYFRGGFLYNGPTGNIYRRDFFEYIGKFDCQYNVAADLAFNLIASLQKPVVVFQRDLFWWRPHDQQEINLKQERYESLNYEINKYYLSLSECPLPERERKIAINNQQNILSRKVLKSIFRLKTKQALSKYHKYNITLLDLFLSMLPSDYRRKLKF